MTLPVAAKDVLRFEVSGEEFAVPLPLVEEIVEYSDVTPVPGASDWIRGIFNLRGRVVPVVDLAVRIGMEPREVGKRTVFIISKTSIAGETVQMALVVDLVRDVVAAGELVQEAVPAFGLGLKLDYLDSVLRGENRYVKVLRLDRVFGDAVFTAESAQQSVEQPQDAAQEVASAENVPQDAAVALESEAQSTGSFQVVSLGEGIFVFEDDAVEPSGESEGELDSDEDGHGEVVAEVA